MTFFFNNSDSASLKQREKTLMQRMITLRLAVVEKKILAEELRQIAALSTSEIENKFETFDPDNTDDVVQFIIDKCVKEFVES